MRFVAMKLRNDKGSKHSPPSDEGKSNGGDGDVFWEPSVVGFLKYLVDCKLVFETLERIVGYCGDVSYAYFRRTGLERAKKLAMDLEWFDEQSISIPEPSEPGVSYATYLKEVEEKKPPLFISHFYNVYCSYISGGQVRGKQAEFVLHIHLLEQSLSWKIGMTGKKSISFPPFFLQNITQQKENDILADEDDDDGNELKAIGITVLGGTTVLGLLRTTATLDSVDDDAEEASEYTSKNLLEGMITRWWMLPCLLQLYRALG